MTKSLTLLIDTAFRIKVALNLSSYELNHYEDGSFVTFRVFDSFDPAVIINLAGALDCRVFAENSAVIIRLYEKYL